MKSPIFFSLSLSFPLCVWPCSLHTPSSLSLPKISLSLSLSSLLFQAWNHFDQRFGFADPEEKKRKMMNRCAAYQESGALGEMRRGIRVSDGVVCPKPRRIGVLSPSSSPMNEPPIRSSRCLVSSYQTDICDSKAGTELLDMILSKGCYGGGEKPSNSLVPSSPPFFCGSPPSRASNPVIQDAQFGNSKPSPLSPAAFEASPSSSARKNGGGGCARAKFGQKPAAVRVEGFNCRGISAVA